LRDNPVLTSSTRLPQVTCRLPDLQPGNQAMRAFYTAELRCLDTAWAPVLRRIGASFAPVRLRLEDDPETACGPLPPPEEATGLYCDRDTTNYLPLRRTVHAFGLTREAHVATLAHEYGHHVQYLSGILEEANRRLGRFEPGSPADRELGRRVELQANCFAGAFLASAAGRGSLDRELAEAAVADFSNWIDSDTHGSSRTQLRWAWLGYHSPTVGACNTWRAPAAQVR
jgi:predicted metalloprotease